MRAPSRPVSLCRWAELTERYYRDKNNWPEPDAVAKIPLMQTRRAPAAKKDGDAEQLTRMGDDDIFMMLYKELYYRFVYGKAARGPGMDARIQSYVNYNDFFSRVLADGDEPLQLMLPNVWLWDIIDEFIYQFQSFCLYKANPSKRDKEEVKQFEEQAHDVSCRQPVSHPVADLERLPGAEHALLAGGEVADQRAAGGDEFEGRDEAE